MPRLIRVFFPCVLGGALTILSIGCKSDSLVPIEGQVTVDGIPVAEGTSVLLAPLGDHKPAHGKTGADGVFRVYTHVPGDGVMPGEYRVVLVNSTNAIPLPDHEITREDDPTYLAYLKKVEDFKNRPPTKGTLPILYSAPHTTPLRWKIPGDGVFRKFELESGAPAK
ncbi:MAG: hypothetical protein C0467_27005 [Planctomycetaceae bacterium]|nr:hypothetical protein [Planctomycetaceae bacterium]